MKTLDCLSNPSSRFLWVLGLAWSIATVPSIAGNEDSLAVLTAKLRVIEIEKQLVGIAPNDQPTDQRLNVIEIKLFGAAAQGDLFDRLHRIERALKQSPVSPSAGPIAASIGGPAANATNTSTKAPPVPTAQESEEEEEEDDQGPISAALPPVAPLPPPPAVSTTNGGASKAVPLSAGGMSTLPGLKKPPPPPVDESKVLKSSVSTNVDIKKPEVEVYKDANKLLTGGKYGSALKLFESLCERNPKEPSYFYGAGACYRQLGKPYDAFADFVFAWHLGPDNPMFHEVAEGMIPELKVRIDDSFKLTYGFQAKDPEAILNAGTRMWKAGLTKQAIKLFQWALKNEPLYAQVAAYNLGVTAEYGGDYKIAKGYYDYAATYGHRLEATLVQRGPNSDQIKKSLERVSTYYIEQARADVQQKLKAGTGRFTWFGWTQAASLPKSWGSEVCPFCAISRTSKEYEIGRSHPQP